MFSSLHAKSDQKVFVIHLIYRDSLNSYVSYGTGIKNILKLKQDSEAMDQQKAPDKLHMKENLVES